MRAASVSCCVLTLLSGALGFLSPKLPQLKSAPSTFGYRNPLPQIFAQQGDDEKKTETEDGERSEKSGFFSSLWPFAGGSKEDDEKLMAEKKSAPAATTTLDKPVQSKVESTSSSATPIPEVTQRVRTTLPASEQAAALKAQAEKARLEAERMDAELTLQKIARLERELAQAKAKGTDSVENLQREMANLQAKLRGEPIQPVASKPPPSEKTVVSGSTSERASVVSAPTTSVPKGDYLSNLPSAVTPFDQQKFDDVLSDFVDSPDFLKKLVCNQLGFDFREDGSLNETAVAVRLDEIRRHDYSFDKGERPTFSQEDIDKMKQRLKSSWMTAEDAFVAQDGLKKAASDNETELALMCLESEYYDNKYVFNEDRAISFFEDEETVMAAIQQFSYDSVTDSTLPPCTRKEGQQPTVAQAEVLVKDILPKAQFIPTSKPLACPGGFLVKGNSRASDGDALLTAIDKQLERSALKDKMTVCWLSDFTAFVNEEDVDLDDVGGILFVGGPNIAREPRKAILSATSALGLATCWYLSLYPFLLNPGLAKRVDEQLALVDANMPADLSWLTDLSFPLFATFVGIQVLHEVGHRAAAAFHDIKPTFPTFVPSVITGVTSVTTSFKEPPKNLQAMFDFSVAGPLVGIFASILAILLGTELSIGADPSNFPALPLEILRQSSLGGGIIEAVMGSGVLNVPDAARGSQAIAAMTIPLHPVAIAGYIGLVVNALSMLPIGTTDGGRVAMALFGRLNKQSVGGLAMLAILIFGVQGSDLFLFYFAFCLAFQKGNEIPCRNEVDSVDFSRVLVATGGYFLALLALIPFQ